MDHDNYHVNKKLDAEFRRILRIIKPYIPCIMNNEYLTSYRLWLEKLSGVGPSEKEERNRYVMELCYQIQDGILEYPFTQLPKDGRLPPFKPEFQNNQQVEHNFASSQQGRRSYSDKNCYDDINTTLQKQAPKTIHLEPGSCNIRSRCNSPDLSTPKQRTPHTLLKTPNSPLPQDFHNLIKSYMTPDNSPSPPPYKTNYHNTDSFDKYKYTVPAQFSQPVKKFQPKEQYFSVKEDVEDDGSWCDVSDMSASTVTKLESAESGPKIKTPRDEDSNELYENKIAELMRIINDLQKQNVKLSENVINYEHAITIRNTTAETSIHNLVGEVNSLKNRLQELRDIKAALKDGQVVAANQWQNAISTLTEELDSAQRDNISLRSKIGALEKKLTEVTSQQSKENSLYKQKLNALQEIETIKQNHCEQIKYLEDKFNNKINEIKLEYDHKVLDVQAGYEKISQDKDREIYRLENLIEVQCKRMHEEVTTIRSQMEESRQGNNESNSEKIVFLQKCIAKMDRLFKKSEKSFIKQVAKLKTEIEMRDKIIHIQLSSQRAELITNTNTEKQNEIDAAIVQLEERYRRLLENQQNYFVTEKKQDTVLISELRTVIAQNNIDSGL